MRVAKNNDGTTTVSGRAIVFNEPSQPLPFVEYIKPQALDGLDFSKLYLLYAHDYNNVLSRADAGTLTVNKDEKGLTFTATLPDTTLGHDVRENILAGNVQGCSFGFNLPEDGSGEEWSTASDGTTIHTVTRISEITELTLTPIPAYSQTSVQVQRDLAKYLREKGANNMDSSETKSQAPSSASTASSSASSATSSASTASSATDIEAIISRAVASAVSAVRSCASPASEKKRCGDGDDVDLRDDDTDVDETDDTSSASASPASTASDAPSSASNASSAGTISPASSSETPASSASSREINTQKEEKRDMKTITPTNNEQNLTRDLHDYLATRNMSTELRDASAGVGLTTGSVLIPHEILTPDHETPQFPRLSQYVDQVSVSTTTGTKPYFDNTNDVLQTKAEFESSKEQLPREIKSTDWKLQSYAGKYTTSRDLLMDAQYDWISELRSSLTELRDNTDDALIAGALTANPGHTKTATDALADIKTALNVNLKPNDSANAQIVLTQSAFDALDQIKDGFGRPMLQPDPTNATSGRLFGKTVIVVADELLGKKAGDMVVAIAPLKKTIIKFFNGQISGQFLDNFDVFDVVLGIFVREDVKNVRPDLVTILNLTNKAVAASDPNQAKAK